MLPKLHRKKSNNCSIVNFIDNGSEIPTWIGYNFKSKSTKIQSNILKINIFFEFQAEDQHKGTAVVHQLIKRAIFIATPMKKHIQQFILTKFFFVNLLTGQERYEFSAKKYYRTWLLEIQARFLFFPYITKMSKQHRLLILQSISYIQGLCLPLEKCSHSCLLCLCGNREYTSSF